MRRLGVAMVVIGLCAAMVPARAAVNVVTTGTAAAAYGFTPPVVVLVTSADATYANLDSFAEHDVTSIGKRPNGTPWFWSDTIDAGETSLIRGLATTPNGEHVFECTVHPSMRGTAIVTG